VSLPTRIRFAELPAELIPRSEAVGRVRSCPERDGDREFMHSVVERWRGATRGHVSSDRLDEFPPIPIVPPPAAPSFASIAPLTTHPAQRSTPFGRLAPAASRRDPREFGA